MAEPRTPTPATEKETLLDHVAVAVPDPTIVMPFLVGELGGSRFEAGPGPGFRWSQWRYRGGGLIEILEPDGPPGGFLHRFLDRQGPGVHHVTFKVPSLRAAADRAAELGYEVVGYNDSYPGWKEAFLHPKQAQGIVIQLAESYPELDLTASPDGPFPDAPDPASEPVTLLGVRLSAASEAEARRQWGELLGGEAEDRDGEIVFRWPPSPMHIAVTLDPETEPGPLALEIASETPTRLPSGPHPLLGIEFRQVDSTGR